MASASTPLNSGTASFQEARLLTAPEVAEILRLAGPHQVSKLCREGKLRGTKPAKAWLVTPADLQTFIDGAFNTPEAASA